MNVDFKFYAITNGQYGRKKSYESYVKAALDAGIRILQVRERHLDPRQLWTLCEKLRLYAAPYKCAILLNDRCDIVLGLDLAGVHLTETSVPTHYARKLLGQQKYIGVSIHTLDGARRAQEGGADFVVAGPLYPSPSKEPGHRLMSKKRFAEITGSLSLPVFALGGLTVDNVTDCLERGAYGVAGISIWMEAVSPLAQLNRLKHIMGSL